MTVLQITITDAGRAEIVNADNTGTGPVTIAEVGVGTGQYTPAAAQTALTAETKRLNTLAGQVVADDTIHVTVKDEGTDAYNVSEFGLYTDSGTLFAVFSQPAGLIMQKSAGTSLLLSIDIALGTINANSLTFGDTSFSNPPATESVKGIAEIATQAETDAGTDDTRIITPKKLLSRLSSYIKDATTSVKGIVELATTAEIQAGSETGKVISPAGLKSCTATESRRGVAEIATQAETDTGTDDTRIITPKKLSGLLGSYIKNAGWSVKGIIEIATNSETQAGIDPSRAVSPAGMRSCTATEARHGVAEIATQAETDAGVDDIRIVTPKKLAARLAKFKTLGVPFWHQGEVPPVGAMEFGNQILSRVTYADLWNALNATGRNITWVTQAQAADRPGCWHTGDGSTTFGVPFALADFLRVWDSSGAIDIGRVLGSWKDSAFEEHGHTYAVTGANGLTSSTTGAFTTGGGVAVVGPNAGPAHTGAGSQIGKSGIGGDDTYPRHIAWMLCFWYE